MSPRGAARHFTARFHHASEIHHARPHDHAHDHTRDGSPRRGDRALRRRLRQVGHAAGQRLRRRGGGRGGGTATLNDAQIAHVAVTANSIGSAAGALAQQKGTSQAVKDFGQTMVADHGSVNKQAVALATKLKVTSQDNDVSKQLKSGADQNMSSLQGKSGADFDSTYIDHEVTYHRAVLDALDNTLIPQAQNAELKALLQKVRPTVAAHLDRAKTIQGELSKTKA